MLTESERIKADIAKAKAELAKVDADIERREWLLSNIRQYREQKLRWLAKLEGQLERAEAPLVKPQPTGVKAGCFDV